VHYFIIIVANIEYDATNSLAMKSEK